MNLKKFSAFKYRHEGSGGISKERWRVVKITLGVALVAMVALFPMGWFALLLPLLAYFTAPKMLYVGPRYLICGPKIVYFSNVTSMALEESAGTLRLVSGKAGNFLLERDRFPTGARKADKIKVNKALKFDKVSAKLIDRVRRASPEVAVKGIPEAAPGTAQQS
jgi:hypothetical protein